jgi:hypothetical protein
VGVRPRARVADADLTRLFHGGEHPETRSWWTERDRVRSRAGRAGGSVRLATSAAIWDEVDGTPVYVTNGAGFWGPPVRVGADPDITLLTLRSARA